MDTIQVEASAEKQLCNSVRIRANDYGRLVQSILAEAGLTGCFKLLITSELDWHLNGERGFWLAGKPANDSEFSEAYLRLPNAPKIVLARLFPPKEIAPLQLTMLIEGVVSASDAENGERMRRMCGDGPPPIPTKKLVEPPTTRKPAQYAEEVFDQLVRNPLFAFAALDAATVETGTSQSTSTALEQTATAGLLQVEAGNAIRQGFYVLTSQCMGLREEMLMLAQRGSKKPKPLNVFLRQVLDDHKCVSSFVAQGYLKKIGLRYFFSPSMVPAELKTRELKAVRLAAYLTTSVALAEARVREEERVAKLKTCTATLRDVNQKLQELTARKAILEEQSASLQPVSQEEATRQAEHLRIDAIDAFVAVSELALVEKPA